MKITLTKKQIRSIYDLSTYAETDRNSVVDEPIVEIHTHKNSSTVTLQRERRVDYRDGYVTPSGQTRYPKKAFDTYMIDARGNIRDLSDAI